jgi:hypothetical protein
LSYLDLQDSSSRLGSKTARDQILEIFNKCK